MSGIVSVCTLAALLFTACPTGSDDEPEKKPDKEEPTPEKPTAEPTPEATRYTITFKIGAGTGTAPSEQKHVAGTVITLPEQGSMSPPKDQTFDGWVTGDHAYPAKASFTVTKNTEFTAQWKSIIDPNKTYIEFENRELFPVIIYSDPLRQTEIARVPAEGKKLIETEPSPQGVAVYPRFLLEFEGIPLSYDGAAILLRADEKKVSPANIPALSTIETGFAYIKIENAGMEPFTFNQGNSELPSLGAASNIIMPGEAGSYQVQPGASSLYRVMKNGNTPLAFPLQAPIFEAESLYSFRYDGNALTLSNSVGVLQALAMLSTPSSVNASVESASSINLTWAAVENATSYRVYRSSSPDMGYALAGTVSGPPLSYTDQSLSVGTTYYYKVQALNSERTSPLSAGLSIQILPPPPSVQTQVESASSITLTWAAATGASEYKVYRSSSPDTGFVVVGTVSALTYTDESLSAGTTYYYKVQAVNTADESVLSERVAITILSTPQQVQVQASTTELSITLTWAAVAGASSFKVYRSTSSNTGFALAGTVSAPSYTDQNLSWEATYYYKIQAMNSDTAGASALSVEVSATTPLLYYRVATSDEMNAAIQAVMNVNYPAFTIALTGSFSLDTVSLSRSGNSAVLTLTSEGAGEKTIRLAGLDINSGVSLVLEENVTLEGLDTGNRLVQIGSGGSFTMKAGSKVHANTGGGVQVNGGTFTMNGGEISGNTASSGGGVYVSSGTFIMEGGSISGNTTSSNGGGVYVASNGSFIKQSGGIIYGSGASDSLRNMAGGNGHAVYVASSGSGKTRNSTAGVGVTLNSAASGATGGWVEISASIQIDLQPMAASPSLTDASLFVNQTVQFSAGGGYASCQWYWNGAVINGATSAAYTLPADSKAPGIYELFVIVITGTGQRLSARCRVTIKDH